jgi:spermidine/putrescine transport system permease protein
MSERSRPRSPSWTRWILGLVIVALYLPILVMFLNSLLSTSTSDGAIIREWSLKWYLAVFTDHELLNALARSLWVGLSAATLATLLGGLASIALSRSPFRFKKGLEKLSYLSLVLPELVFALSLLSWFFILGVQLSLTTVIIAHVTFSLSFVIMTVNGRLIALDRSLEDAARDLGATEWQIFFRIILPLLKPAFASGFLLAFMLSFDDFLNTFFTIGMGMDTLPIKLYSAMKSGLTPKLSALSTLMFLMAVLIVMLFVQIRKRAGVQKSLF